MLVILEILDRTGGFKITLTEEYPFLTGTFKIVVYEKKIFVVLQTPISELTKKLKKKKKNIAKLFTN